MLVVPATWKIQTSVELPEMVTSVGRSKSVLPVYNLLWLKEVLVSEFDN